MSRKKKPYEIAPWFKCYPKDWLEDTMDLTPEEDGLYHRVCMHIYATGGPLQDDHRSLAFRLRVDQRVWKRVRRRLLAEGFLYINSGQLMNKRCATVLAERAAHRRSMASSGVASPDVDPDLFENVIDFNAPVRPRSTRIRSSDTDREKERGAAQDDQDDDDPHNRRKDLDPKIVETLKRRVGEERGEHMLRRYFRSNYARGAQFIDKAFPQWIARTYGERISDELTTKELAAEILELCGQDKNGKPDITLPKVVSRPKRAGGK